MFGVCVVAFGLPTILALLSPILSTPPLRSTPMLITCCYSNASRTFGVWSHWNCQGPSGMRPLTSGPGKCVGIPDEASTINGTLVHALYRCTSWDLGIASGIALVTGGGWLRSDTTVHALHAFNEPFHIAQWPSGTCPLTCGPCKGVGVPEVHFCYQLL